MSLRLGLVLASLLAIGVASFVVVRSQQGEGSAAIARQQQAKLTSAAVAAAVRAAPDPFSGERATQTSCAPVGAGPLQNPWRCTLRYAPRREVQFRVVVSADGQYVGTDQVVLEPGRPRPAAGSITGCCVSVP